MKPLLLFAIYFGKVILPFERSLSSLISIDAVSGLDYARFITDTINFFSSYSYHFCWSFELGVI